MKNRNLLLYLSFVLMLIGNTGCSKDSDAKIDVDTTTAISVLEDIQAQFGFRTTGTQIKINFGNYISRKLKDMGYTVEEQPFTYGSVLAKNYIARKLQSASAKKIIICAHYDSGFVMNDEGLTTTPTYGVDDNGSGVACVLEIAKWAKNVNLPYTVEFILFDEEETGSNGSTYYINSLSDEEIANIAFVGNIDSVAAGDYCYIYGGLLDAYDVANPTMTQAEPVYNAYALAKEMGLSIRLHPDVPYRPTPSIGWLGDNTILIAKKIPYIYMEATNWDIENSFGLLQTEKWGRIMHTDMDNLLFIRKEFGDRVNKNIENYIALLRLILLNGDKMNNKIE